MPTVHRGRVLVAENDADTRALISELLVGDGREVVEVGSGEELLQVLTEQTASTWPEEAFARIGGIDPFRMLYLGLTATGTRTRTVRRAARATSRAANFRAAARRAAACQRRRVPDPDAVRARASSVRE